MTIYNHGELVDYLAQFDTDDADTQGFPDVYYEQSVKYWDEMDTSKLYDKCVELGILEYDKETEEFYS